MSPVRRTAELPIPFLKSADKILSSCSGTILSNDIESAVPHVKSAITLWETICNAVSFREGVMIMAEVDAGSGTVSEKNRKPVGVALIKQEYVQTVFVY